LTIAEISTTPYTPEGHIDLMRIDEFARCLMDDPGRGRKDKHGREIHGGVDGLGDDRDRTDEQAHYQLEDYEQAV